MPAILKYTRTVYYMDNQEVVVLKEDDLSFYSMDEEEVAKAAVHRFAWARQRFQRPQMPKRLPASELAPSFPSF